MATDINVFRGSFSGQAAGGPAGGGIVAVYTFATLPATYAVGQPVWVSDIGRAVMGASPVAATGSLWAFNGTIWAPVGGRVLLAKLNTAITGLTNSEVVSAQLLLPAAFLKVGDRMRVEFTLTKSGTTDTCVVLARMGTAGTTADQSLGLGTTLNAASTLGSFKSEFRIASATTTQLLGRTDSVPGGVAAALASPVTIANISNALYFNFGATSNSTNNTVGIIDIQLWLSR